MFVVCWIGTAEYCLCCWVWYYWHWNALVFFLCDDKTSEMTKQGEVFCDKVQQPIPISDVDLFFVLKRKFEEKVFTSKCVRGFVCIVRCLAIFVSCIFMSLNPMGMAHSSSHLLRKSNHRIFKCVKTTNRYIHHDIVSIVL